MIEVNLKLWSWIIVTIVFLIYILFLNNRKRSNDLESLINFGSAVILYLMFWVGWLLVFN
jgi:hypothetical protein